MVSSQSLFSGSLFLYRNLPGYSASRKRRLRQAGAETDRAVSPVCYGIHASSVGCHLSDLVCVCRSNRIGL